jgi:hypothetical protein
LPQLGKVSSAKGLGKCWKGIRNDGVTGSNPVCGTNKPKQFHVFDGLAAWMS